MVQKRRKAKITPIILPHREGDKIAPTKKLLALHYHPNAIRENVKDLKEMSEDPAIKNLFQDIEVLVNWALDRLPLAKPKKEDEPSNENPSSEGSE